MATSAAEAIVGRDGELAAIAEFFDDVAALPAALVLAGDAGIGKTTLWRRATAEGAARGWTVLACTGAATETRLAFTGLGDLLGDVWEDVLPALPEPQRRALSIAMLMEDPAGVAPDARAIAVACTGALRAIVAAGPTIVAVDDVQWLDKASLAALEFAARRLDHGPAAFVLGLRTDREGARHHPLERALPRLRRVDIGPLSVGALHRILTSQLTLTLPRPLLRRLADAVDGNPYFALEIGRALRESGAVDSSAPLPVRGDVRELVAQRIRRLAPPGRAALLARATVTSATEKRIASLSSHAGVEAAIHSGILLADRGNLAFAHPLLAEVVYADATDRQRRDMHRRAADTADDVVERALHLARASEEPDEVVSAALEAAGSRALERGAPMLAAELLERAADLTPPADRDSLARRTTASAIHYTAAGDEARARRLLRSLLDDGISGRPRADALLALARAVGDRTEHRTLCDEALRHAGDDEHRAKILLALSYGAFHDLEFRRAAETAASAAALAEAVGNPRLLARALAQQASMGSLTRARDVDATFARAIDLMPDGEDLYNGPATRMAWRLVGRGETHRARPILESHYALASEQGNELDRRWLLVPLTELEWRSGNLAQAQAYVQDGLEFAEQLGSPHSLSMFLALRGLLDVFAGDLDEARRRAEASVAHAEEVGSALFRIRAALVLAFADLAEPDYEAAASGFAAADAELRAGGAVHSDRFFFAYEPDLVEAHVGAGNLHAAEEHVSRLEAEDELVARATATRGRGLLAAANGDTADAIDALAESLELWGRVEVPFERGRALLFLGTAQRRAKRRGAARETLEDARRTFAAIGARRWSARAAAELQRIGGRTRGGNELTAAEQRVAALVAAGKSNKEAAAALFVTVHTVEAALTRIYGKLGIRSRSELAAKLAGKL